MFKDRVLIIEDNEDIRELLEETFTDLGCEVKTAGDGNKGVEILNTWKPDLILLDIMLPKYKGNKIDVDLGYEICRDLKSNVETRDIPILMLTARGQNKEALKGYDLGADDYVIKPYTEEILVAKARVVLRRAKLRKYLDTTFFDRDSGIIVKSKEDLKRAVVEIINGEFRHIIEKREGYKILYNDDKTIRKESNIQPILRFLSPLMETFGLSLEREVETGRGPVDFKCSGISYKTHIELKRSSGSWEKGLKNPLRQYMESDKVNEGIYIVIWYGETKEETWEKRKEKLMMISENMKKELNYNIELIFVDASVPTSASKS